MSVIGEIFKIGEFINENISQIKNKVEADDSVILADRYYQKGIIDLALVFNGNAIKKNENNKDALSWLYIHKGDLLTEKGMNLYQNKVHCTNIFERSIEAFDEVIKLDPLDSVAWLGKGFSHVMVGLIYTNDEKNETKGCYHFHQTISSADAGLGSSEEKKPSLEVVQNLWGLKGGALLLIGDNDEEANECFEKAGMPKTENA